MEGLLGLEFSAFQLKLDLPLGAFPSLRSAQDFLGWAGAEYLRALWNPASVWTRNGPLDLEEGSLSF